MIFINYRIADSLPHVDRLDTELTRTFGTGSVFRDKSGLDGGDDWSVELERNARTRPVMLVVIGAKWQTAADDRGDWAGVPRLLNPNDWVRKEIALALDVGSVVIPVFIDGGKLPTEGWLKNCGLERLHTKQGEPLTSINYDHDLAGLIAVIRKRCPELPYCQPGEGRLAVEKPSLPTPPAVYAVPEYPLTSTFIGRATELDELDAWARSTDPLMVVEGIGGLGKSALTWQWMQTRATYAIPDLAGRVWWGFYEKGTSMSAFVRHALAYITGQDPDTLAKETSHLQRCGELLRKLRKRPFLLVLDGFERVLTAYHRWDKAQQRDDHIDAQLRECVDPRDGELLQQLVRCGPSKVLVSTRLVPALLEDRATHRAVVGVAHHKLNGLSRPDALTFYRHVGVKGDEVAMLDFANQFGYHSLVLKVVCGEIGNYPPKPFDFDAWRADPAYGGRLKLKDLDLRQTSNHILRFALEGLDEQKRKLLCRIAVLSENVPYDTVAVLNPYLPVRRTSTGSDESIEARRAFDRALKELQDRGLLQWDRDTSRYDMHPVVRGHAAELLEGGDRTQTFLTVRDHFAGLPPDDLNEATDLSHVAHSLEIYRCLIGAGRLDDAYDFFQGDLSSTLIFVLGAYTQAVELLTSLFHCGRNGLPNLTSASDQGSILNSLAIATGYLGREEEAVKLQTKTLRIGLDEGSWNQLATRLRNLSFYYASLNRRAEFSAAIVLARNLAEVGGNTDGVTVAISFQAADAIEEGRFADGERLLSDFHARPQPSAAIYRPGTAERWSCVSQFYQGLLTDADWQRGYEVAVRHRNVFDQYRFLALRGEWLLTQDQPALALDPIDEALKIVNRLGTPKPDYHDLRAWALAKLGRADDAQTELAVGKQQLFAAETWYVLGDRERCRTCTLNAYRWAWADGPPHIRWYQLERCRALLKELGEPEPQLPPFDPSKVPPVPYEDEIRATIPRLRAERKPPTEGT